MHGSPSIHFVQKWSESITCVDGNLKGKYKLSGRVGGNLATSQEQAKVHLKPSRAIFKQEHLQTNQQLIVTEKNINIFAILFSLILSNARNVLKCNQI